jgi:6-phosphogluconolactonase
MPKQNNIVVAVIASAAVVGLYMYLTKLSGGKTASEAKPTTRIYEDKATVSKEVCAFVAESAKKAIAENGVFHLAVAGGSLLDALALLKEHKESVDFSKVVLSFANHKCVAPGNEKATVFKAKSKFAADAGIKKFVIPTTSPTVGGDGSEEAAYYAKQLEACVPHEYGLPVIDLILLGLGADGHIGSNHPIGPAVAESRKAVAGSPKQGEPSSITLTVETMNSAKQVALVVCGGSKGKREAVKRALARPAEEPRGTFPAQLLKSPIFFLDKEAAADL